MASSRADPGDAHASASASVVDAAVPSAAQGHRIASYAALGGAVSVVPLPWISSAMLRRVRGALVHEVAARRGLSLAPDARAALAATSPEREVTAFARGLRAVVSFSVARALSRHGPLGLVSPLTDGARVYALGRLFDRYIERHRSTRAVRIDATEARRVRRAVDAAVIRAFTVAVSPPAPTPEIDDQRDPLTARLDAWLARAAGVPDRLAGRLDAAFDAIIAGTDG